jgi:hypothetical protein
MAWAFIAIDIDLQVSLMVILRIPPLARRQDLGDDLPLPPLLVRLLSHVARDLLLLRVVVENPGSVLCAYIWALLVGCRWVMHAVEEFKELSIRDFLGVIQDMQRFSIYVSPPSSISRSPFFFFPVFS